MSDMAYSNSVSGFSVSQALHAIGSAARSTLASVGRAMVITSSSHRRLMQIEHLQAKSDAELAEMGLKREDIARYVFRDILFM